MAARGGLPVNVFEVVAGHVLAKVVELAPFAEQAVGARAGVGAPQEERGGRAIAQVGIDAQGASGRARGAGEPQTEGRSDFEMQGRERMIAARDSGGLPIGTQTPGR